MIFFLLFYIWFVPARKLNRVCDYLLCILHIAVFKNNYLYKSINIIIPLFSQLSNQINSNNNFKNVKTRSLVDTYLSSKRLFINADIIRLRLNQKIANGWSSWFSRFYSIIWIGIPIILVWIINIVSGNAVLMSTFDTLMCVIIVVKSVLIVQICSATIAPPINAGKSFTHRKSSSQYVRITLHIFWYKSWM